MKTKTLLIMCCFILAFSKSLWAESFIAHCRDYPPRLYFEEGTCVGVLPDLVNDIFSELGHEIKWIKTPWIRSLHDAKVGNVDLLIRHSMTPEREAFLLPIVYAHQNRTLSFYKSPNFKSSINSYDDLTKVTIGAIRGNYYSPRFSYLDTQTLVLLEKTKQLLAMLEAGRIDIAVTSPSHNEELFEGNFEKAAFTDSFYNPMYISIAKKSKAARHLDAIAKLMLEYRKSGKINHYFEKYGLPAPKQIFE